MCLSRPPLYGFLFTRQVQDFLCHSCEDECRGTGEGFPSSNPTLLILPFYAGITKLSNEGVYRGFQKIGMKLPHFLNVLPELLNQKLVTLTDYFWLVSMHCLYEANREEFCSLRKKLLL